MKKIGLFALPLLLLSLWLTPALAQLTVNGKIIDADDKKPVEQVSISINKKGIGTATNSAGLFTLIIPTDNAKDSLKISSIGYKTQTIAIANLKRGEQLNLSLKSNTTELKEVTIAYYDADKIMQKAIASIPSNFINYRHVLRGFYRMYTYNDTDPLQLSEAVFDVFNFGYGDTHADVFRLVKARTEKNERDFTATEVSQKPNSIFEQDIINHLHACGFLTPYGLTRHTYKVNGVVDLQGYRAYEIAFREVDGAVEGTFRGRLYVDVKTHAFIHFDFGLSPANLREPVNRTFIQRSLITPRGVEVNLKSDRTKVSYQQVGNKWVLASVEGNSTFAIKDTVKNIVYPTARVKFNYQITQVDTTQQESFSAKIGRNDNINAYKSNGNSSFWKDYNIILSDYNVDDTFTKLKEYKKAK
ncbi:MAG: carboxypeptidase-like regulatory domain-containing protein [Bacteroidota bacterium]